MVSLTGTNARLTLKLESDYGPIRRDCAHEESGPARRASHDCAHQWIDSELRKFAHASARGRIDCGDDWRRLRGSRCVGGGARSDEQRNTAQNGFSVEQ